jgi:hypothetical protein
VWRSNETGEEAIYKGVVAVDSEAGRRSPDGGGMQESHVVLIGEDHCGLGLVVFDFSRW